MCYCCVMRRHALLVLLCACLIACGGSEKDSNFWGSGKVETADTTSTWCLSDATWVCPELCDRMSCTGLSSDCIRDCSAELQDCTPADFTSTCDCFEEHLKDVVCQTWEAAQPGWDSCISEIGCFDDY